MQGFLAAGAANQILPDGETKVSVAGQSLTPYRYFNNGSKQLR